MRQNVLKRRAQAKNITNASGEASVCQCYLRMDSSLMILHQKDENIAHNRAFDDLTDKENPDCKILHRSRCIYN